jgi:hypothetical protein
MSKRFVLVIALAIIAGVPLTAPLEMAFAISGDFNGDGYEDLAIGVPGEDVGDSTDAGAVNVIYGSPDSLTSTGDQLWSQSTSGIEGVAESYDYFGYSLAAGDFDGDGYEDLAIGVLYENVGTVDQAGAVNVIYGSLDGLTATGDQFWHQDVSGILDAAEASDYFGYSLAAGEFDGDSYDDLAIGVPYENVGTVSNAGGVHVIWGSSGGLTPTFDYLWSQNTSGILDTAEASDLFGYSVAASDFDGDGYDDLAIGVPSEDVGTVSNAGAVSVIYGTLGGLTTDDQFWHQDVSGILDMAEASDFFGRPLTAGDFDGDGYDDLAIGVYAEDVGTISNAGGVHVIYGSSGGLTETDDKLWNQNSSGILDTAEASDLFGRALAAGDFDGDGYDDLAIGVPYENVGTVSDAGAVNVIYGSSGGLTSTADQFWHQDVSGILGVAEASDLFGYAL